MPESASDYFIEDNLDTYISGTMVGDLRCIIKVFVVTLHLTLYFGARRR